MVGIISIAPVIILHITEERVMRIMQRRDIGTNVIKKGYYSNTYILI